ncbi:MAG: NAD-dependent epimerase/dehydratase family protein [Bacteroidales bacterium]|nr:NAD-dependent epimerase/dehydratase family protein [Bacteroidales bacterium]
MRMSVAPAAKSDSIPDEEFFRVNSTLALRVAELAKLAGVKHFIYLSSVKVFGEKSLPGQPFDEQSKCNPHDGYAKSKIDAEYRLSSMQDDNFTVAIVRSTMVYGPGVKANMLNMIKLVEKLFFLPFGNINNKRSMVFSGNLVALLNRIIESGAGGLYLAADPEPVSTEQIIRAIVEAAGKKRIILNLPGIVKRIMTATLPFISRRILGNFEVDAASTYQRLAFTPPYSFREGINEMYQWYRDEVHRAG